MSLSYWGIYALATLWRFHICKFFNYDLGLPVFVSSFSLSIYSLNTIHSSPIVLPLLSWLKYFPCKKACGLNLLWYSKPEYSLRPLSTILNLPLTTFFNRWSFPFQVGVFSSTWSSRPRWPPASWSRGWTRPAGKSCPVLLRNILSPFSLVEIFLWKSNKKDF